MPKYTGAYREQLWEEDNQSDSPTSNEVVTHNTPQVHDESENWKKRYGDLRSHTQKQINDLTRQLETLQQRASEKEIVYPATEKEVAEWVTRYPNIAKIIDSIVQRRVIEGNKMVETKLNPKLSRVDEIQAQIDARKAWAQLLTYHPDFPSIRTSDTFRYWLKNEAKPWAVKALTSSTNLDASTAADAIDLYKKKYDIKVAKRDESAAKAAAKAVTKSNVSHPYDGKKKTWKESEVARLKPREYERLEKEIEAAMRSGNFDYDLSGGAR